MIEICMQEIWWICSRDHSWGLGMEKAGLQGGAETRGRRAGFSCPHSFGAEVAFALPLEAKGLSLCDRHPGSRGRWPEGT